MGDLGLIPGLGRPLGEGNSYPVPNSGLENSMDYSPWGHKESDRTERPALPLLSERMADLKFKSGSVAPGSVLLRGDSL